MEQNIIETAKLLKNAKFVTAFTGAGISVESGIPPFRGSSGLWSKYNPIVLDINYFHSNTDEAWQVIKDLFYIFFGKATPNPAHKVLATLEEMNIIKAVITQNIDNLHQEAGSKEVYEYHGTAQTLVCTKCGEKYFSKNIDLNILPPLCKTCKGVLKPNFIFFGEGIPQEAAQKSLQAAIKSDVFIVIGTTGEVMPASMLPHTAKQHGAKIVEINIESSNYTNNLSDIFLQGKAGEVLPKLLNAINQV